MDKNIIPEERVFGSRVLSSELEKATSSIIQKDIHGHYRFDGKFRNGDDLKASLLVLGEYDTENVHEAEEIFSDIFNHHEFTGRSGTFYKYEGLGCIYWHMVSKLLLAVEENAIEAFETGNQVAGELAGFYTDIKDGIGAEKSPDLYGAFPTDAYSHTPGFAGVQQPGMTGQVKEDIISRFGELGISVVGGRIQLKPYLLESEEFLTEEKNWKLFDGNVERTIKLEAGEFGFTYCTVPFIYRLGSENHVAVYDKEGQVTEGDLTSGLSQEISNHIFSRNGQIDRVEVVIKSA